VGVCASVTSTDGISACWERRAQFARQIFPEMAMFRGRRFSASVGENQGRNVLLALLRFLAMPLHSSVVQPDRGMSARRTSC